MNPESSIYGSGTWNLSLGAVLIIGLLVAGCGPRGVRTGKPGENLPGALVTPSLVDVHVPVAEEEYQAALARVGNQDLDRQNLRDYLTLAQYRYNRSEWDPALGIYQKAILQTGPVSLVERAKYMVGQVFYDKGDYLPSLSAFQALLPGSPKSPYSAQAGRMMEFILSQALRPEDLSRYLANYPDSPKYCFALYQLGSQEARSNQVTAAMDHLGRIAQTCPDDPLASDAQMLLKSLQERQQGKTWKVAVLAPTSGQYAGLGSSVVNGVKLALDQANATGGTDRSLSVVIRDSRGDSIQAVKIFQELSQDGSLDAVIGPVLSRDTEALAPLASQSHVPLISPCMTRDGLSQLGPGLFNNGITNEMQARAIARFAVEKLGLRRFGILSPDDGYGKTLAAAFRQTVTAMGATVLGAEEYPPGATDFKGPLVALGGQDPDASKDNEKENKRRFDSLDYSMSKEIGKILLKNRETAGAAPGTQIVAFVPVLESLGSTLCPSLKDQVDSSLWQALNGQPGITLRNPDLVSQALERLPEEAQGTSLPASADAWTDVAQDLQANLLITGIVSAAGGEDDDQKHQTWDYVLRFEAIRVNSKKGTLSKLYQSTLTYRAYKDPTLTRTAMDYQALFMPAHSTEVPLLASQVHFYDLSPIYLGGHLWESDNVLTYGKKEVEGSYFPVGFYVDSSKANVRKFAEDYQRKYAVRPDLLAAQAYDATRIFLQALDGSSSREDIIRHILSIRDFDGVTGRTTFDGKGEAEKVVPILRIHNGKYEQVQ